MVTLVLARDADQEGLIAYYDFDTDLTDGFENSFDLTTREGSPTIISSNCGLNDCVDMDGNDCASSDSLATEMKTFDIGSICFWVRTDSAGTGGGHVVLSDYSGTTDMMPLQTSGGGTYTIDYYIHDSGSQDWKQNEANFLSSSAHFICLTQDGISVNIWKDGVNETGLTTTTDVTEWWSALANADHLAVGCFPYNNAWDFNTAAAIDELSIWNITLTESNIGSLYNSGSGCNPLDSVCWSDASPTLTVNTNLINNTENFNDNPFNINYNGTLSGGAEDYLYNCELIINDTIELVHTSVNLSNNNQFSYDTTDQDGNMSIYISCHYGQSWYNATSYDLIDGSLGSGALNGTYTLNDSVVIQFDEVTGVPGLDVRFNFTDVTGEWNDIHLNVWYDGYSSHNIDLQLYNNTAGAWQDMIDIDADTSYNFYHLSGIYYQDYTGSNIVLGRIYHVSEGNINHDLYIDLLELKENSVSDDTGVYLYRTDTIDPTISTNLVGGQYNYTENDGGNFNYSITVQDNNLDGMFVNITDQDGTNYHSFRIDSLTDTIYIYNLSESYTDLISGMSDNEIRNFTTNVTTWDTHTAKEVRDVDWRESDNYLWIDDLKIQGEFKFYNDVKGVPLTYLYQDDDKTKYKMKLTFEDSSFMHVIHIDKKSNLRYIEDSQYMGHFIMTYPDWRWLDFEGKNIESVDVLEFSTQYRIQFNLIEESDELELESYGDLNVVSELETFSIRYDTQDSLNTQYLASIDESLNNIEGELDMLGLYIIWISLAALGYYMSITANYWVGLPFLIMNTMLSAYFATQHTNIILQTSFLVLAFGTFVMWFFIRNKKTYKGILFG